MRRNKFFRYFIFAAFLLVSAALVLLSTLFPSDFHLLALTFLLVSIVTIVSTFLDAHIAKQLRILFYILGGILLASSIVGFILTELNLSVDAYCTVYALMEIISGVVKVYEGITIVREKNKMGFFFIIDGLIEIALGILMTIEKQEGLRTHVYLVAADKVYEGAIKFINEFIEDKRGVVEE